MFTRIVEAVADWAASLVFNPFVWIGCRARGVSVVLFVVSGLPAGPPRRAPAGRAAAPKGRPGGTRGKALPPAAGRGEPGHRRRHGRDRGAAAQARHQADGRTRIVERNRLWSRLDARRRRASPSRSPTPLMVVDLDAFDANADDLVRRAGGKPIRVASKSLRVPGAAAAGARPATASTACWPTRCAEALWLHEQGVSDDIVVAYPTVDRGALAELVGSPSAAARDHPDGRRRGPPRRRRLRAGLAGGAGPGRDRHRRRAAARAASTSGPSAPRCTTPTRWSASPATVAARGGLPAGRRDDLRGPGRRASPTTCPRQRARSLVVRRLKAASLRQLAERAPRRSPTRCAEVAHRSSCGTPAGPARSRSPRPTRWSPRWPPAPGCWCRRCSTTTESFTPRPASYFGAAGGTPSLAAGRHRARRRAGRLRPGRLPFVRLVETDVFATWDERETSGLTFMRPLKVVVRKELAERSSLPSAKGEFGALPAQETAATPCLGSAFVLRTCPSPLTRSVSCGPGERRSARLGRRSGDTLERDWGVASR